MLSLYVWREGQGGGGVGDDSCLFLYSGQLTSVEKFDSDPIVEDGACITSLLVLVDRAQVQRGRGKLGPDWASLSPSGGGGCFPHLGGGGGAPLFAVLSGYRGGGGYSVRGKYESTNTGATNICHFLKMSKQIMYGSQKLVMRNSGHLLLFPSEVCF